MGDFSWGEVSRAPGSHLNLLNQKMGLTTTARFKDFNIITPEYGVTLTFNEVICIVETAEMSTV